MAGFCSDCKRSLIISNSCPSISNNSLLKHLLKLLQTNFISIKKVWLSWQQLNTNEHNYKHSNSSYSSSSMFSNKRSASSSFTTKNSRRQRHCGISLRRRMTPRTRAGKGKANSDRHRLQSSDNRTGPTRNKTSSKM